MTPMLTTGSSIPVAPSFLLISGFVTAGVSSVLEAALAGDPAESSAPEAPMIDDLRNARREVVSMDQSHTSES
jgi:hypothetical protein